MVARNHVSNVSGGGDNYGIYIASSNDVIVRANSVAAMDSGIYCDTSSGKYFNNVTQGIAVPYTGGTAGSITN